MRFTLAEVAAVTGGRLVAPTGADVDSVDGACIDSRAVRPASLFVPVVAVRDGHDFIAAALDAGAAASLVDERHAAGLPLPCAPTIVVGDTVEALTALGRAARSRLPARAVGITGSVGKTSVKDLTRAAIATTFATTASEKSFNNELGVPLTLVNAAEGSEAAVVEMGARGPHHIAHLCTIARPTIGVVTCVAPAHLELFGSIDGVAAAKGELLESLPAAPDGTAVLNADDANVLAMARRTPATVVTFGTGAAGDGAGADLRATHVQLDDDARARFTAQTPWGHSEVRLAVAGAHMVGNALAALAAACAAGVPLDAAAAGLATAGLSPWRMEVLTATGGAVVLNDAYNASPVAMRAAFATLSHLGSGRKGRRIAVLGRMAELGVDSDAAHRAVAADAADAGIEVFAVDTDQYGTDAAHRWADLEEARAGLDALRLGPGDVVLVKASRVVGLERLAAALLHDRSQP